ncbi:hypothetical protein T02_8145 [Trichinella nativa]|uniref:Uncharacterized protein n=1 Tax=Trichinella nativa TaxID=6335 RepID=A0A0V1KRN4_9BILA|nr:hypothetical protein T02_8145 [Trichinella nativa]
MAKWKDQINVIANEKKKKKKQAKIRHIPGCWFTQHQCSENGTKKRRSSIGREALQACRLQLMPAVGPMKAFTQSASRSASQIDT